MSEEFIGNETDDRQAELAVETKDKVKSNGLAVAVRDSHVDVTEVAYSPRLRKGKPQALQFDSRDATFRDLIDLVLSATDPMGQELKKDTAQKQDRFNLIKRVWKDDVVDLSARDKELIRDCAVNAVDVMTYGVMSDHIDC
jgi:hypothetical protein